MESVGKNTIGQLWLGKTGISAAYIGVKEGTKVAAHLMWEAISNCIAGGWWQSGHGWQSGIGWGHKHK